MSVGVMTHQYACFGSRRVAQVGHLLQGGDEALTDVVVEPEQGAGEFC